ncbi:MAG: penicillin-binding protein 1C [bacterium]
MMTERKIIFISLILCSCAILFFIWPTRRQLLSYSKMTSLRILDRNNIILREVLSSKDATSRYCMLDRISPWLIKATVISEDKRFYLHKGIDPLAISRSLIQNLLMGRVVSGGSTISQQLARNLLNSPSRNLVYKIIEVFVAINLELKLSKEEILELYFNYAPYGNQTYGVEAAAHLYLRKPASDLSLAEAAFLAGIPQAPSFYNPYRYPERIKERQQEIFRALLESGIVDSTQYKDGQTQPVELVAKEKNFLAPHFCEHIISHLDKKGYHNISAVKTTLDNHLQKNIEQILKNNIDRLTDANVTNAAVVVLDNHTMDVLAYVGSVDFFDPDIDGEVDGVRSLRQPGSALKPFTYALALENNCTAASLIPDMPSFEHTRGGDYMPRNYDEKYHGMVRLRNALACSYNIPAVRVCGDYGPEMLLKLCHDAGFESLDKSAIHYGVGLTLGNGEVTLLELTRAYSVFAHYGRYLQEQSLLNADTIDIRVPSKPRKLIKPETAYIIMDILSDNNARSPAFGLYSPLNLPFFCAVKTGTSKDFKDNWCVGFTDKYLVGVWVGNFDGSPMHHVSGITGAGPIFRDIMLLLHRTALSVKYPKPDKLLTTIICAESGEVASSYCYNTIAEIFTEGTEPSVVCRHHTCAKPPLGFPYKEETVYHDQRGPTGIVISFPDDGDIFKIDPVLRSEYQVLTFQILATYPLIDVSWFVNDSIIGTVTEPYRITWQISPGRHRILACGLTTDEQTIMSAPVSILVLE